MVKKLIFSAVIIVLCGFSAEAEARSVVRFDDEVIVADKQAAEGDFYSIGSKATISGDISGDAHVVAGKVDIRGTVASDTLAVGATVTVDGEIGDDLRVIGVDVTIAGHVKGDLMVIAQTLTVLDQAKIDGDVIFFGHEGTISGVVGHDVFGRVTTLRLDGPVAGTVDIAVGSLTLGDKAAITGNVQYESVDELVRAPNAAVTGEVMRTDPASVPQSEAWRGVLGIFVTLIFAVGAWYLLLRRSLEVIASRSIQNPLRAGLVGLSVLVAVPFLVTALFVSQVGIFAALLLLVFYVFALGVATIAAVAVVGEAIRFFVMPKQSFGIWWLLVGTATLTLLLLLPTIFVALPVLALLIALGSFCEYLYQQIR